MASVARFHRLRYSMRGGAVREDDAGMVGRSMQSKCPTAPGTNAKS